MNSTTRPIVQHQYYYSAKREPDTKPRTIGNNVDFVSRTKVDYFSPKPLRDPSTKNVSVGKHVEKLEKSFVLRVQSDNMSRATCHVSRVQSDNIDLKSRGGYNSTGPRDACLSRGLTRGVTRDNRRASREITSTKEFEDRATSILADMRRQRRSLKLESATSVQSK